MKKQFLTIALLLSTNAFAISGPERSANMPQYQTGGSGSVEMNAQLINAQQTVRSVAIPMFAAGVIEMASTQVNPTAKINEITHMINEITRNMKIWSPVFGQLSTDEATNLNAFLESTIQSTLSSTVTLMNNFATVTNNQQAAINTQINSLDSLLNIEYYFLYTYINPTESQNMKTAVQRSITNALANIPATINTTDLQSAIKALVLESAGIISTTTLTTINLDLKKITSDINALLTTMRSDLMELSAGLKPQQAVETPTIGEKINAATKTSNHK